MTRVNVTASTLHRTVADVAEFLEANVDPKLWGCLDGGTTLEIYSEPLKRCRQAATWNALEARYEAVGGSIYSPDDNEWEVA